MCPSPSAATPIGLNFKLSSLEDVELAAGREFANEIGFYKWRDADADRGDRAQTVAGSTIYCFGPINASERGGRAR